MILIGGFEGAVMFFLFRGKRLHKKILKQKNDALWDMNDVQLEAKSALEKAIAKGEITLTKRLYCVCGNGALDKVASTDRFGLDFSSYICKKCGLIFTSPYISEKSLPLYYNDFYHPLSFGNCKAGKPLFSKGQGWKIFNILKDYLSQSSVKVFEVGAGSGSNLVEFRDAAIKKKICVTSYGTEFNQQYVKYGKAKGLRLKQVGLGDYVKASSEKFDVIIMSHVFEHFTDLMNELKWIKQISHKKTLVYVEVPGVLDLNTRYVYDCEFLKYLTHAHTFNFSLSSLQRVFESAGFELLIGNEVVEAVFRVSNVVFSNSPNKNSSVGLNYRKIVDYLIDLENNLTYYKNKNPNKRFFRKLKNKMKSLIWKVVG